uniref:Reticulon domain-containing protein n=1 Tax=Leersia perrieri TaxID=77586 RepID=A0A0D9X693_9ORYZ
MKKRKRKRRRRRWSTKIIWPLMTRKLQDQHLCIKWMMTKILSHRQKEELRLYRLPWRMRERQIRSQSRLLQQFCGDPEKKLAATIDLRSMNPEPMTIPPVEKKPLPVVIHRMTNAEPTKPSPEKKASPFISRRIPKQDPVSSPPVEEEYEEIQGRPSAPSRSNGRMQNIGQGENVECDDAERSGERYLVGEEEAIWLLRLVLPYINEVLLNLRSLFSGEPATTMKLALLLFAMARCGNFVTLWTLAKLVFFGVFIIPKVCSSYSTQLARYGRFWLERFRDGWESCSHKKAVVAAVFTLVWNVSSTVARVWAVFMLVVAMKCYQQRMMEYGWSSTVDDSQEATTAGDDGPPQEETPARSSPAKAQEQQAQGFGAAAPRQRRTPVSGEFARERLRVRGGIQPRADRTLGLPKDFAGSTAGINDGRKQFYSDDVALAR